MGKKETPKKILLYSAVIFSLTLVILFFVLEFRFIKKIIEQNDDNIRQIVLNELSVYLHGLQNETENAAQLLGRNEGPGYQALLRDIAARNATITEIYLLDHRGYVLSSLSGKETGNLKPLPDTFTARGFYSGYEIITGGRVSGLGMVAAVTGNPWTEGGFTSPGNLIIEYSTSDFQNKFLLKYTTDKLKVSVLSPGGHPLVWPFEGEMLKNFNPRQDSIKVQNTVYTISRAGLDGLPFEVFFFARDYNFDTYRIITIMFLLFTLYFLIYQFIVELLRLNNINSYFDHFDFNIFNNLKEGVIIANQVGKVVFANSVTHEIFAEKRIVFNETRLKEIIGPINSPDMIMLKKTGDLLEITSFPIIINGKLLGSMVVISPDREKEKLFGHALHGIVELLPDGVIFVDKNNKIVVYNMMATYYLGNMGNEMDIHEVNAELANLIESNIGSTTLTRVGLSFGNIQCELKAVYEDNGLYAGTVVFIR